MFDIIMLWYKEGGNRVSTTEKEKEILKIIETFINKNGYSPTIREICKLANLKSTSSVHGYIKSLEAKGHLTSGIDMPRSIALTKKEKKVKFVVNAIALMNKGGKSYIMIEEKKKSKANISMLELPGGIISGSENIYGCLRREFKDKGFEVTKIFGEDKCNELGNEDEAVTMFKPFCVSQRDYDNNSIIYNTILCEVDKAKAKNISNKSKFKWVCTDDLEEMLVDQKEKICVHSIAALKSFCNV